METSREISRGLSSDPAIEVVEPSFREEAVAIAFKQRPDVVLMDVIMENDRAGTSNHCRHADLCGAQFREDHHVHGAGRRRDGFQRLPDRRRRLSAQERAARGNSLGRQAGVHRPVDAIAADRQEAAQGICQPARKPGVDQADPAHRPGIDPGGTGHPPVALRSSCPTSKSCTSSRNR